MKGKIGYYNVSLPENLDEITHIWKTHAPSLSFKKYQVDHISWHKQGNSFSIITKPTTGENKGPKIMCVIFKDNYVTKRNIQFSEREAAQRLAKHIGKIVHGDTNMQDIDIDLVNKNMEFLKDNYPELVL